MNRGCMALSLSLALVAGAGVADAKEEKKKERKVFEAKPITSRWRVVGGTALNSFDTSAAFSPEALAGVSVHLESDLGLEEETETWIAGATYRLSDRHRLEASVTDFSRDSVRVIDQQIEWGDVVYDVGATVTSNFDSSLFKFKWKYSFADTGRLDAGLSAGLSTFDFDVSLAGEGLIDDGMGGQVLAQTKEGAAFVAPVPIFGFWVDYAFSPRWIVRLNAEAIDLSIGAHNGRVLQSNYLAEYYVSKLVGLGFGLTSSSITYSQNTQEQQIGFDYKVKSFAGYLSFVF